MTNLDLVQGSGFDVDVHGELVILASGTPENGETIELNDFNSVATCGTASHYRNGNDSIYGWEIVGGQLKLLSHES